MDTTNYITNDGDSGFENPLSPLSSAFSSLISTPAEYLSTVYVAVSYFSTQY